MLSGLAFCRELTEGQGATLTIILPLKQRHPDQLALPFRSQ
jgi:signal transduction histidine kinase